MTQFARILAGDPAPAFTQRSIDNPRYAIDTAAGRYLVLCFFHTSEYPASRRALEAVHARSDLFNDVFASFFGITTDPRDSDPSRVANRIPGYRHVLDFDHLASRKYGASSVDADAPVTRRPVWVIVDPTMRVIDSFPFAEDGSDLTRLFVCLDALPPPDRFAGVTLQAPILFLPRVFEPEFCKTLIGLYDQQGGELSGFMREVDGKTVGLHDKGHKVRRDVYVENADLIAEIQRRIVRRIVPEIAKVHQYTVSRMERYLVACYDSVEGGHFAAHRDNTTPGTAHRRFAVSINLNDDFQGGEVAFPEYGPKGFKAPAGGAVVFSCSLLHMVSRVTAGRRYAFLPFLYDDAAAALRQKNRHTVVGTDTDEPLPQASAG